MPLGSCPFVHGPGEKHAECEENEGSGQLPIKVGGGVPIRVREVCSVLDENHRCACQTAQHHSIASDPTMQAYSTGSTEPGLEGESAEPRDHDTGVNVQDWGDGKSPSCKAANFRSKADYCNESRESGHAREEVA